MYRFYASTKSISQDKIIISHKAQVHHIRDVLRLKVKDKVIVFDDKGNEYDCVIEKISHKITLSIKDKHSSSSRINSPKITVACAIPKKSKMDDIVDKLTQLGVNRIIPLETERVVIKLDKDKKATRLKRWETIALSAAGQSQRNTIPTIEPIKSIKEVLSDSLDFDLKIIPTLTKERKSLKEIFVRSHYKNILVLVGPEGDFTPEEVNLAKEYGCVPVSLGDNVLRVETAAIAIVSFLILHRLPC